MTDLLDFLLSTFRSAADAGPAAVAFLILGAMILATVVLGFLHLLVRGPRETWQAIRDSWREADEEVEEEHRRARDEIEAER